MYNDRANKYVVHLAAQKNTKRSTKSWKTLLCLLFLVRICAASESQSDAKKNHIGCFTSSYVYLKETEQTHTNPTSYLSFQNILLANQSHCKQTEADCKPTVG